MSLSSLSIDLRVCCVGFVYDHVSDHYVCLCGHVISMLSQ